MIALDFEHFRLLVLGTDFLLFFLVVLACQAMGTHGYLLSPSLAAWCPLMIFAPVAVAAAAPVWES